MRTSSLRETPRINLIDSINIFLKHRMIGVVVDCLVAVPAFEIVYDLVQLIDLGVHDSKVAH